MTKLCVEDGVCVCDSVVYERWRVTKLCVCDKVVCVTKMCVKDGV